MALKQVLGDRIRKVVAVTVHQVVVCLCELLGQDAKNVFLKLCVAPTCAAKIQALAHRQWHRVSWVTNLRSS